MKSGVTWGQLIMVAIIGFLLFYIWVEIGGRRGSLPVLPNTNPANRVEGTLQ